MNKKGFAISIILYSMVFLLITILFVILGIHKTRYNVSNDLRNSIMDSFSEKDYGDVVYRNIINKQSCAKWTDNMGTASDTEDDVIYTARCNSGFNLSNYRNYVWYSGKLWRIVAIYPDRTMKLVTDDIISVISFGSTSSFNGSWIYEWLNEDFLDTLYNADEIVADSVWNYTADSGSTPSRPESLPNQQTLTAKVGLLTAYEYMNTGSHQYTPINYSDMENSYLNITIPYVGASNPVSWWFLTPGKIHYANTNPIKNATSTDSLGVRPSIRLKYGVRFKGSGSSSDPYTIITDKAAPVNNTTLLNTRSSGEYVNFNGQLWRIVDTEDGITKIVANSYTKFNNNCSYFASTQNWGVSTNSQICDNNKVCCDYYYNNTWYNSIPSNYKNMMVDGTYYLGSLIPSAAATNYKKTICKGTLDGVTTKNCTRYTESDNRPSNNQYYVSTSKVGLPRVGEMFSSIVDYGVSGNIYLISPSSSNMVNSLNLYQLEKMGYSSGKDNAVHLTVTLSSSVKITSGKGTMNSPFNISL